MRISFFLGSLSFFVQKKDGSLRLFTDYCSFNAVTDKNRYSSPLTKEFLDQVGGAQIFSKINLTAGYNQVRIREEDVPKSTFRTKYGSYESLVMNFGMTNAPSTFVTMMNDIFREDLGKHVVIYLDDIIVYSKDEKSHVKDLRKTLTKLRESKLYAKPSKCEFFKTTLTFLGHVISAQGIAPDTAKVEAVNNLPRPTDIKQLQSFLGLVAYIRKFIPQCSELTAPLSHLLQKGVAFFGHHNVKCLF